MPTAGPGASGRAFRLSEHDLRARPISHHRHESIDAHPTIGVAVLAVTGFVEDATGSSITRFVRIAMRYRTARRRAGPTP
ncbi:hypothetical protein LP52_03435 [Streptomonospora alba]|uniref:Uncharacterized protein n=1 Tax=Streptomonospora alba TaxID=183763 RepID=A0A0C2JT64_9ACTN|nr:hypothetical protein [Streptomonospora alba]KII00013.1 hypothetical protein LP52_03435 [Streptomonospora alba]